METKLPFCKEQISKIEAAKFLKELLEAVKYLSMYITALTIYSLDLMLQHLVHYKILMFMAVIVGIFI